MFQLNDDFLRELGLDQLPDDQKQAFKEHIYSELELRVGVRLSEGLSERQLNEFESFVDRDEPKVRAWIAANTPDYLNDPVFIRLRNENSSQVGENNLLAEYASLKWLATNRPNYRDVVAQVLEELKREIIHNRDAILGNDTDMAQAA
jgi:aspartyl-tRNA synthetase